MKFDEIINQRVKENYSGKLVDRTVHNCENFNQRFYASEITPIMHRCKNFFYDGAIQGFSNCHNCLNWDLKLELKKQGKIDYTSAIRIERGKLLDELHEEENESQLE